VFVGLFGLASPLLPRRPDTWLAGKLSLEGGEGRLLSSNQRRSLWIPQPHPPRSLLLRAFPLVWELCPWVGISLGVTRSTVCPQSLTAGNSEG